MRKAINFIFISLLSIVLVAVALGTTASAYAQNPTNQYVNEAFNSKAANFRLTLNMLLQEHTILAVTTLKGIYRGEDTTRLQQLMDTNQGQLASLVQQAYGVNAMNTFNELWSEHMKEYINYANAKKNNNTAGMDAARKNLQTTADKIGALLETKNLPATTVSNLMMQHINGTLAYVDAVAANNPTQQANLMQQGYTQAATFGDTIAKGILLDKPQLFQ